MKNSTLLTAVTGTVLLLAGAAAEAQPRDRGNHGQHRGRQASMMLMAADANGDRSVTRAEVDALQAEMFAWMDRNSDGYLDQADQSPMRQRLRARHESRMEDGEGERRRGRGRGRGRGGEGHEGRMRAADTNGDERLSQAEYMAMGNPAFDRLDADENGVVSPDELDAAVERRQNRGRWWRD
jgi:hypothetical protein